LAKLEVSQKV